MLAALASGCGADVGAPITVQPFLIESSDSSPAWSPDGSTIAYVRYRRDTPSTTGIWAVNATTGATHLILAGSWSYPDWSPDGTLLAISAISQTGIYTVSPTGAGLLEVTTSGSAPSWSPTGNQLAFQSFDTTGAGSIWLVSPDGSRLRQLSPTGAGSWYAPDWSPDGTRLVHLRRASTASGNNVFLMDTTGQAGPQLTAGALVNQRPTWSPDGQWIAWSRQENGGTICIMKPDGTQAHVLTSGTEPSWSPDSRKIAFSMYMYNAARLFTVDIASLKVRQITQ
jgi:TolB protein